MKRNWYAAIILLALCVLLFRAGQYVDRTTAGMQRQLEAAYALAEQGDYPAARRAYSRAWQTSRWRHSAPAPKSNRRGNHFSADFERLSNISFSSSIKVLTSLN